jgi:hypothetical protein
MMFLGVQWPKPMHVVCVSSIQAQNKSMVKPTAHMTMWRQLPKMGELSHSSDDVVPQIKSLSSCG